MMTTVMRAKGSPSEGSSAADPPMPLSAALDPDQVGATTKKWIEAST